MHQSAIDARGRVGGGLPPCLTIVIWAWLLSPASALAACGDWLAGHGSEERSATVRVVEVADALAAEGRTQRGEIPCDGPTCSRAPGPPASVPPVDTTAFDGDGDALPADTCAQTGLPMCGNVVGDRPMDSTHAAARVERPPITAA